MEKTRCVRNALLYIKRVSRDVPCVLQSAGLLELENHLVAAVGVAALFVEGHVLVGAVENDLVCSDLLGDGCEGVDEMETELLALFRRRHGNVFDVAGRGAVVDQLSLNHHRADRHNPVLVADNDHVVVCVVSVLPVPESFGEVRFRNVSDRRQHCQSLEHSSVVVRCLERSDCVSWGQTGLDGFGNERGVKERSIHGVEACVGGKVMCCGEHDGLQQKGFIYVRGDVFVSL